MAETIKTKKMTDLAEKTEIADSDIFIAGNSGTPSMRRVSWRTMWNKILSKIRETLLINNATTTEEGYALDARQGKVLQDQVTKLNTNINRRNYLAFSQVSGTMADILTDVDHPNGFIFYQAQFATDNPENGMMSFVITCRSNSLWGFQWLFMHNGHVYTRNNLNGTVSAWNGPL